MKIPRITPTMLSKQPDQVTDILNRLIDRTNEIDGVLSKMQGEIVDLQNAPMPTIDGGFYQVVPFDPTQMGSDPGWCLRNVDRGFGIMTGTYPTARADMEAQLANGTLHDGTPPIMLQVPVYVDTGTVNGHVVVWDRGVVWSDGAIVPDGLAHYGIIYGWGERCDDVVVVAPLA